MKAKARVGGVLPLILGLVSGCHASANASAEGDATANGEGARARAQAEGSGQAEGGGEMTRSSLAPNGTASTLVSANASGEGRALLGARHDLRLRAGQGTAGCECLSVALGGSHNRAMSWSAVPAELDESEQLSVALSSEGSACQGEPKGSLGASYWGYRLSGNDVIVLVEAARDGRPLTNGAIIPKPVGTGQVYVAPTSKKLPYGRALEGDGLCKIGNPGAARTSPFTQLEVGFDAPTKGAASLGLGRSAGSAPLEDAPSVVDLPAN